MRNQDLIDRAKSAVPGAFDELYYAYVDRVHKRLYTIIGPDPEVEDLIQATFVQVFRTMHSFKGDSSFSTWLHRVTVNVALGHLRKRDRRRRKDAERPWASISQRSLDEQIDEKRCQEMLYDILDSLHPKKRTAFLLYEIEGHTLEEIASLTEAPLPTVAARLRAGRKEVRRAMARRLKGERTLEVES